MVNILFGKEFDKIGRKQNKTLTLNAKVFFSGGQRYIPLLRDANENLAVDPINNRFWDYNKAYDDSLGKIFKLTLSVNYKINRPKLPTKYLSICQILPITRVKYRKITMPVSLIKLAI